jgi:hypothetical protein
MQKLSEESLYIAEAKEMSEKPSPEEIEQKRRGAMNFNSFIENLVYQETSRKALEKILRAEIRKILRKRLQSVIGINSKILNALDDDKIDEILIGYISKWSK